VLYRPCVKVNVITTCHNCTLEYGLEVRSVTTRPTDQQSSLTPGNTTRSSTSRVLNSRLVLIIMGRYNESGDYLGVEERNTIPALVAFARAIYLLFSNPNLPLKFPNPFHVSLTFTIAHPFPFDIAFHIFHRPRDSQRSLPWVVTARDAHKENSPNTEGQPDACLRHSQQL